MRASVLLAVAVPVVVAACSGGGGNGGGSAGSKMLGDLDQVAVDTSGLAAAFSIASAPNVYALVAFPMGIATTSTDGCPILEVTDFSTTVHGPCTDANDTDWDGELRMSGFSEVLVEMDAFQFSSATTCGSFSLPGSAIFEGEARLTQTVAGMRFEVDLTLDPRGTGPSCGKLEDVIAVDYAGESVNGPDADADGEADFSVWNGAGRVGLLGAGRVRATTEDEHLDGIAVGGGPGDALGEGPTPTPQPCYSEAASGRTLLAGDGRVAELRYDGAENCDPAGSIQYFLDDVYVSGIGGVACSAAPIARGSPFAPLALLALGIVALSARRR